MREVKLLMFGLLMILTNSCRMGEVMSEADPETETATDTVPVNPQLIQDSVNVSAEEEQKEKFTSLARYR